MTAMHLRNNAIMFTLTSHDKLECSNLLRLLVRHQTPDKRSEQGEILRTAPRRCTILIHHHQRNTTHHNHRIVRCSEPKPSRVHFTSQYKLPHFLHTPTAHQKTLDHRNSLAFLTSTLSHPPICPTTLSNVPFR